MSVSHYYNVLFCLLTLCIVLLHVIETVNEAYTAVHCCVNITVYNHINAEPRLV